MRKGFTLLELIFVIVILGVMSKFGVELLYKIYVTYVESNTFNRLQGQTEIAVEQIANRLKYRIKDTTVAKVGNANLKPIGNLGGTDTTIEWIGVDIDGWRGAGTPLWSGLVDLNNPLTTNASLVSPGSLGAGAGAVFFIGSDVDIINQAAWNASMIPVNSAVGAITGPFAGRDVFEFYQFATSAYQISLEGTDLVLYSGYQPWNGQGRANRQLLMEDVRTFNFGYSGDILLIKVCMTDNDATGTGEYVICKEKVVF